MGVKVALISSWPLARFASGIVAELRAEGHIADATLGLCWRAWLKMSTGGEVGSSVNELEVLGSDSARAFVQLSGSCLR